MAKNNVNSKKKLNNSQNTSKSNTSKSNTSKNNNSKKVEKPKKLKKVEINLDKKEDKSKEVKVVSKPKNIKGFEKKFKKLEKRVEERKVEIFVEKKFNYLIGAIFIAVLFGLIISFTILPRFLSGQEKIEQTCFDEILNQNEEKIDCGGICSPCKKEIVPTCFDGILNQGEKEVDCDGPCKECEVEIIETCFDGILNQNEEEIDCGGSCKECEKVASMTPFMVTEVYDANASNFQEDIAFRNNLVVEKYNRNLGYGLAKIVTPIPGRFFQLNHSRYNTLSPLVIYYTIKNNSRKEQIISVETDAGYLDIYIPEVKGDGLYYYFYVADDGSTYYANKDNSAGVPDINSQEAYTIEHLARKSQ